MVQAGDFRIKNETLLHRLTLLLQTRGIIPAHQLIEELGISRATLSRLMARAPTTLIRLGNTRSTQYGLLRALPGGLSSELPLFRITESGTLQPQAKLQILHHRTYVVEPGSEVFTGIPPEIADMAPQGFMGRGFGQKYSQELGIPTRPQDWSNDHLLISLSKRGEDLPGNLILGEESAERWMNLSFNHCDRKKHYPEFGQAALQGQPIGACAGGEQPKFTAFVENRHVLVKFAGPGNTPAERRWRDLLHCEEIALQVLGSVKIESARAQVYEVGQMTFLEVERFDRMGGKGRRSVLTLAAVDDALFGDRDCWASAAVRLERSRKISTEDADKIKLLDAFGAWIGDSDRHYYNLAFFPESVHPGQLTLHRLRLAPAFDKLPMMFAPVGGQVVERRFKPPLPNANVLEVWDRAAELAIRFWRQVSSDSRISQPFQEIATQCLKVISNR